MPVKPLVSFLVPTHGRASRQPAVLAECLYWLTRQTLYPKYCEILIVNDAPGQTLTCNLPSVRVINVATPFASLGEKRNFLVEQAAADICVQQDDDDIPLPRRGQVSFCALADGRFDYFVPSLWYYAVRGKPPVPDGHGVGHMTSAFRKSVFAGHYPNVTKGEDAIVHSWGLANARVHPWRATAPKDILYYYRWGVSEWHLSGNPDMDWAFRNTPQGRPGTYELVPQMGETDWEQAHQEIIRQTP